MEIVELTSSEELRYSRQINLKEVDLAGQERLKASSVLIVGIGGLGCAVSQYLAGAGVGRLVLLDFDCVSLSNLQRQVLHWEQDLNQSKVQSAQWKLAQINPHITIERYNLDATDAELTNLIKEVEVVLDCTDNLDIRKRLDLICSQLKKPLVSGSAIRYEGLISTFTYAPNTPTYASLSQYFGEVGQSCVETGVLAPIVGVIGSIQALEAVKILLNIGKNLCGRLLLIDGLTMEIREIKF